jgi:hypothetical protein
MQCVKCKKDATCVVQVEYSSINKVFACTTCVDEVKKDFNLAFIHHDSDDMIFVNRIHKKYGI